MVLKDRQDRRALSLALDAAASAHANRRLVLKAGAAAGLTVAFSLLAAGAQDASPTVETSPATPLADTGTPAATPEGSAPQGSPYPTALDAYLRVNEDGSVHLSCGKIEYGQGIATGFRQLVAEELNLPFDDVTFVLGDPSQTPFDLPTYGSLSTQLTGPRIRQAAATMRDWLLELAASTLQLDVKKLELKDRAVVATADPSQSRTFAELAAGKQASRDIDVHATVKAPADFTIIGTSVPRPDVNEKVNGVTKYGIDSRVDGMVFGAVVRPPAYGATLKSVDFSEAEKMPGYVGSVHTGNFAAIAAERLEQAEAAVERVHAEWEGPDHGITSDTIFDFMEKNPGDTYVLDKTGVPIDPAPEIKDLGASLSDPVSATFRAPYVNHAPIEPRNSLVSVTEGKVEAWVSTQSPFEVAGSIAKAIGVDPATVVVHPMATGGAFGSKILPMADPEAAMISQAVKRPVKLIWRRDEEFAHGQYRPAMQVKLTAGVDKDGKIEGWDWRLLSAVKYEPAYYMSPFTGSGSAAADWSSWADGVYDIANCQTVWNQTDSPLPSYYWRVNGATTNTFARESMMDMLAEKAGVDPVTFRINHLAGNPRLAAVLNAAVKQAGWTPGVGVTGQGIGVAIGIDANSYVAEIARVEVDQATGEVSVKHVDVVIDAGLVINPEAVKHQGEGAVVLGLSSTLNEIITFENGAVTNPTFAQYGPITMRQTPSITVGVLQNPDQPMTGVGEPMVAPTTGAVANAVYDLLGVRLMQTPFTKDRVLAVLKKQGLATPMESPAATPAP